MPATGLDPALDAKNSAATPTLVIRKVHDRVFIGPQSLIASAGIDDPKGRPWYEITTSTPPVIAALSAPNWADDDYGAALPKVTELVAAATTLIDLGPQADGPAAHQYQMTVDIRTVPNLLGLLDLTPEQTLTLADESPLLTAFLWLDDRDRTIKLIAAHSGIGASLSLIESASRFNEPLHIEVPRSGEIVTDR